MQRAGDGEKLFCLDEIQRLPELFAVLRSVIDESGQNGQFLILGSASRAWTSARASSAISRIRRRS